MLKKILIGLALIVAIVLVAAAFMPKKMTYEKSVQIDAPKTTVWKHTNSLKGMDSWSPWNAYEPDMKKEWSGQDGEVGSSLSWDGTVENVGAGNQTIAKLDPPHRIDTDIHFTRPWESSSSGYVTLEDVDGGTKATWGFSSNMSWPLNIMTAMMDMEKQMGKDWDNGLNALKKLAEDSYAMEKATAASEEVIE